MTDGVRHSVYCLATDVLDEGAGAVLDNIAQRARVRSLTVAAKYHTVSDVYPHNPVRKLADVPPGVFYRPHAARYSAETLRPFVSPVARGRDVLEEVCAAAAPREMGVAAWAVVLHHDEAPLGAPELQANCFGDQVNGALCPSNPDAQRFAGLIVEDIAAYPVDTVRLESVHFHGISHGHHHERLIESYGDAALLVLGLCFCRWCLERCELEGVDGPRVAAYARSSLDKLFYGRVRPRMLTAEAVVQLCGDDALEYLSARQHTVTSLAARLVKVAGRNGTRISIIDPTVASQAYTTGLLVGGASIAPWQFGLDMAALRAAGAAVEVTGYLSDPGELAAALAPYRGRDLGAGELAVILRLGPPDCASAEQLRAKLAVAKAAGSAEVNFYNYGLYRLEVLERIGSALA